MRQHRQKTFVVLNGSGALCLIVRRNQKGALSGTLFRFMAHRGRRKCELDYPCSALHLSAHMIKKRGVLIRLPPL